MDISKLYLAIIIYNKLINLIKSIEFTWITWWGDIIKVIQLQIIYPIMDLHNQPDKYSQSNCYKQSDWTKLQKKTLLDRTVKDDIYYTLNLRNVSQLRIRTSLA